MCRAAVRPDRSSTRSYAYWQVTGGGQMSDMPIGKRSGCWPARRPQSPIGKGGDVVMAQPIRRGSRFPVSLFEPTALWDPVSEFEYLRDRMGRLYEQIAQQGPDQSPWQPDIEVDETEEFYLVKAELPGITRENVELQVDEHSLAITGSLREDEGEKVMRRRMGRFFYRIVLNRATATEKVQATMKEGVLTIRLPKTKQATRRVQIRA